MRRKQSEPVKTSIDAHFRDGSVNRSYATDSLDEACREIVVAIESIKSDHPDKHVLRFEIEILNPRPSDPLSPQS